MRVVLALADVGLGIPLQEALERLGHDVRWTPAAAAGPPADLDGAPDVVALDADEDRDAVLAAVAAWRTLDPPPGLVGLGQTAGAPGNARAARIALCSPSASPAELADALADAAALRLAAGLAPGLIRRALGLPAAAADGAVIAAARAADVDLARAALRWHAHAYATADAARVAALREARALVVPEIEQLAHLSGNRTLQTAVQAGPLDPHDAARLLWALASIGAVIFTPEPIDAAIPERRALAELRGHLAARSERLVRATLYDVLELTPAADADAINAAAARLARRYGLAHTSRFDLGDRAALAAPCWDQIERARRLLADPAARARYHGWLRTHWAELRTTWAIDAAAASAAAAAFARAQEALAGGDVHRALSETAIAARHHPGHPDYETGLAWALYRVDVIGGADDATAARRERAVATEATRGFGPWPRALVALALLCVADRDAEAARWHLREALAVDPQQRAARQLIARLGG